uniref:ASCH domain-containing protein n=1 Tax=viral metagenome TaxID=1070528 RepID=A0A6C0I1G5_9ZZZZ
MGNKLSRQSAIISNKDDNKEENGDNKNANGGVNKGNKSKNEKYKNSITYKMHLSEPWFSLISLGIKDVEGRLNRGKFAELKEGDIIEWNNEDFKLRIISTRIVKITKYKSFTEYIQKEKNKKHNPLPGLPSLDHELSVYYKYYSKEDEQQFGVIAIQLALIN